MLRGTMLRWGYRRHLLAQWLGVQGKGLQGICLLNIMVLLWHNLQSLGGLKKMCTLSVEMVWLLLVFHENIQESLRNPGTPKSSIFLDLDKWPPGQNNLGLFLSHRTKYKPVIYWAPVVHTEAKYIIECFNIKIILWFLHYKDTRIFSKKKLKLKNKTTISI